MTMTSEAATGTIRLLAFEISQFQGIRFAAADVTGPLVELRGANGSGKSSIIHALTWGLTGGRALPEMPVRRGADAATVIIQTDKYRIERKVTKAGTAAMTLHDATGNKVTKPAELMAAWLSDMATDPLAFAELPEREQATALAKVAGMADTLDTLARRRADAYDQRTAANRQVTRAKALLAATPLVDGPDEEQSASELIERIRDAEHRNGLVAKGHQWVAATEAKIAQADAEVEALRARIREVETQRATMAAELEMGKARLATIEPVDVEPLHQHLRDLERLNQAARRRRAHHDAAEAVRAAVAEADGLERAIEDIDTERRAVMRSARLPIEGVEITDDGVRLHGIPLAQASTAQRIRLGVAAVLAAKPQMRLVFIERGESLDDASKAALVEALNEYGGVAVMEKVVSDRSAAEGVEIVCE